MRLYHRTPAVQQILVEGFRDHSDTYGTGSIVTGVWFADRPIAGHLEPGEVLVTDMPDDVAAGFEFDRGERFRQQWKWREFVVPAGVANRYGPPRVVDDNEDPGATGSCARASTDLAGCTTREVREIAARQSALHQLLPFDKFARKAIYVRV
jgi:hypothetical protein